MIVQEMVLDVYTVIGQNLIRGVVLLGAPKNVLEIQSIHKVN